MRMKNNYHTHLKYCNHAVGVTEDYVLEAIKLGFGEIGITDHAPIPDDFMTKEEYDYNYCNENMKLDFVDTYIKEVIASRELHKDQIKVYTGFESEYLQGKEAFYKSLRDKVDYLNLGVHFFYDDKKNVICSYDAVNYQNIEYYTKACIEGMETGLFNTLVHPDLFFTGYKDVNGKRIFDECCKKATRDIIESAIKNDIYLEVNCNALKKDEEYNDPSIWKYPIYDFWMIAKEYKDLKIIVGCDAHDPKRLSGKHVDAIYKFIDEIGLNILDKMEINH